ncbi:MAG TPA: tetratricopeptide repeat protein [Pirellulales bacterium]|nr:tetratricopeptide repeat protein [Pirellulales bacterium]
MASRPISAAPAQWSLRDWVPLRINLEWRIWLPALLLVAMVCVAYLPALRGSDVLDDDVYVTGNSALRSAAGLRRIWFEIGSMPDYYTLVYSSFWVEYHLWGLSPLGYHAMNIALHALCAVLLWRLLVRLRVPGGWLAAAIFAVHPVCVESVAWITERKNTLSMFFALASMLCYLRFAPIEASSNGTPTKTARRWQYAAALLLFALALLSKTQVVALPAVLLVIYWWKQGSIGWRTIKPLTPFFALGLALAAVTLWIETAYNGAGSADWAPALGKRFIIAGRAVWFYAGKLFWPQPLAFIYPRWTVDSASLWQWMLPLAVLLVTAALWLARRKIGRGPLAGTLIFVGLLFPVLGVFNVCFQRFSFVADHFQYHAAAAFIALMTAIAWKVASLWKESFARRAAGGIAAAILAMLMLLSWQHSRLFANADTLYRDTLAKNPDCWLAHNNLGNALQQAGHLDEAMAEYQAALRLKANYPEALVNLGTALVESNRIEQAIAQYQQAIDLKPEYAQAHNYLGVALAKSGQPQSAVEQYQLALQLNPNDADAHNNWGTLLLEHGQRRAATQHFQAALALNPDDAEAHSNLGSALHQSGRNREAVEELVEALRLNPNLAQAHNILGAALMGLGRTEPAMDQYRTAVRLTPHDAEAQFNLGIALLGTRRPQEAVEHFQEVLRQTPHDLVCALNLAIAYAQSHQHDLAVQAAQAAEEIARSTGEKSQAEQIQTWLKTYEASTLDRNAVQQAAFETPMQR